MPVKVSAGGRSVGNSHRSYPRDTDAEGQFSREFPWFNRVKGHLEALVQLRSLASATPLVLDIGCNTGGLGRIVMQYAQYQFVGVDLAGHLLPLARKKGYRVVQAAGEFLPFSACTFDAVVLSEILEHADDPKSMLSEAHRVLKPNGILCGDCPTWYGRWGLRSLLGHKWHRRALSALTLRRLLRDFHLLDISRERSDTSWLPEWYVMRARKPCRTLPG